METDMQKRIQSINYLCGRIIVLLPYFWPGRDVVLLAQLVACLLLLIAGRIIVIAMPLCNKYIYNSLTFYSDELRPLRWDLFLLLGALRIIQTGIWRLKYKLWNEMEDKIRKNIEIIVYEHFHNLSLRWHLSRKTAEIISIVDRGANGASSVLKTVFLDMAPAVLDIAIGVFYMLTVMHLKFSFMILLFTFFSAVLVIKHNSWRTEFSRINVKNQRKILQTRIDSLLNYETVKYNCTEQYEVRRYIESLETNSELNKRLRNVQFYSWFAQSLLAQICSLFTGLSCAYLIINDAQGYTIGDYALITNCMWTVYNSGYRLSSIYSDLSNTILTNIDNLLEFLAEKPEVSDAPNAREFKIEAGRIDFDNVSFHYTPERPILKNITFAAEPGSTVALVGPTGSGKTTIIRLLVRFFDVQTGQILFDGQNVKMLNQKSLRMHMGVVPQDTVLFNDTVRYNIRYGRLEATDTQVEEAAKAAQIHHAILTFPNGYDTEVGERGLKLSGGEKQRVAIARTILRAPDFTFLDEATSALDTETEQKIQRSIRDICRGKTTVIVAHRLSTIVHADEILVLKEGEIVERGRHAILVQKDGLYSKMWNRQLDVGGKK